MTKAVRPVLLVGGVSGDTAEQVFKTVAPILGSLAIGFTDGEIGLRRMWIFYVSLKAAEISPQSINFVQMSVPRHRDDNGFFVPLGDLKATDTTIYAGLIPLHRRCRREFKKVGGVQTALRRANRRLYRVRAGSPARGSGSH